MSEVILTRNAAGIDDSVGTAGIKHLSHKHEGYSSDPQHFHECWVAGHVCCQYIGGKDGEPLISLARLAKSASSESEGKSLLQYIRYRTIT